MTKLVLVRHGESEWNKLNLFTGWTDVELSDKGHEEAKAAGQLLKKEGYQVSFKDFIQIGIPYTLTAVITGYLYFWFIWA